MWSQFSKTHLRLNVCIATQSRRVGVPTRGKRTPASSTHRALLAPDYFCTRPCRLQCRLEADCQKLQLSILITPGTLGPERSVADRERRALHQFPPRCDRGTESRSIDFGDLLHVRLGYYLAVVSSPTWVRVGRCEAELSSALLRVDCRALPSL